ncbi:hypothetical protein, partial [Bacillus licheniformis]|uniref:hypothetical protein n=1 Tax=Bacillus licheniformis TaxID=1402 RepID=UPI0021B2EFB2
MDQIDGMDEVGEGIDVGGYGERNRVGEYEMEGFGMFAKMIVAIEDDVGKLVMKAEMEKKVERDEVIEGQTTGHEGKEGDEEKEG